MLLRGIVTKSKSCFTLQFKFTAPRALSSKAEVATKTSETLPKLKERRFVKPLTNRELEVYDSNFVLNLYKGEINKKIFEYPLVFEREELQSVIRHSLEVEDFLKSNLNIPIKNSLEELKKLELFGLSIPKEYGGAGYTATETKFLIECCGLHPNLARFLGFNDDVGSRLINLYGTEEQKQKYLPRLASGESQITLAYLEKGPLIDFSSFEGSAIVDHERNGFLINAKKKWVHNANVTDLIMVLAKSTAFLEDDEELGRLGFDFYIVEKSTPGVSVHQLKSGCAKDLELFEIDFENVRIPKENKLGHDETLGFLKLQHVLAHRELTDAFICCALIKRILHSAVYYCENKVLNEKPLKDMNHVQVSIGCLSAYAYALESLVYLISARFDTHVEPNLFHEGILAKILSVEMLQLAIEKYVQILGYDGLRDNEILQEALKVWHYCSVFDENNTYLKLILSTSAMLNAKPSMVTVVKHLRKKYDYPWEAIKYKLSFQPKKISKLDSKLGIKGELNGVLSDKGDILELCLGKLKLGVEGHFINYGNTALEDEFALVKYAEMATYVYALAASLSRASTAFCYDLTNSINDIDIARLLADIIQAKFEQLASEALHFSENSVFYKDVGKISFANKEYPAEHPLSRAY